MEDAQALVRLCTQENLTISSCESLTAGLFTSTIASIPGASAILKGGIVTYFTEMKVVLANVDQMIIDKYGVISSQCASEMAFNTRKIMDVDYCVSFTGNAGPSSMEDKPAGCVFCAISSKHKTSTYSFLLEGLDRSEVRQRVVDEMIKELILKIKEETLCQKKK